MANLTLDCDAQLDMSLLAPHQYQLVFSKLPHLTFFCQSVNMPDVSLGMAMQYTNIHDVPLPGDKLTMSTLSANILVDKQLRSYEELFTWLKNISQLNHHSDDVSDCTVVVAGKSFTFEDVFPIQLSGFNLTSISPDSHAITFQATFAYTKFDLK